jgi:hypothetical protein
MEKTKENGYGSCIFCVYGHRTMKPVEFVQEGQKGMRENNGGGDSN